MSIATVVAGAYTSNYAGVGLTGNTGIGDFPVGASGLGFMDDNGYELEQQTHGEMVDRTDLYGQSLLDWVHQGGSVFMTFTCMTFQQNPNAIKRVFYPWGGTAVSGLGIMANVTAGFTIGRLASRTAASLVLTAVPNTPVTQVAVFGNVAGSAPGPLTITAPLAILPPGSNLKLMYASRVRKVPCRMALLPLDFPDAIRTGVTTAWWVET